MANDRSEPSRNGDSAKIPPQDLRSEVSVLGSMMRDNAVIDDVCLVLRDKDFYLDAHQKIYRAAVDLHDRRKPVDCVTLAGELDKRKQVADIGGYAYLAQLWEASPTAAHGEHYARLVREKSVFRALTHLGAEMLRKGYDQAGNSEDVLAEAERDLFAVAEVGVAGNAVGIDETLQESLDRIDLRTSQGGVTGLQAGLTDLDNLTAGFQDGELTLIGARPSVGKTSLAIKIAHSVAVQQKQPVFFVSLEQPRVDLGERLLIGAANVDSHHVRTGRLSTDEMDRLIAAGGPMRTAKLFIDDTSYQTVLQIAANARRLRRRHGLRMVIVDYVQLVDAPNRQLKRHEQIGEVTRRLKFLAKELSCPVVALAQLNRAAEDRTKPRLSDLRESGSQEQDADVVMLLHLPDERNPERPVERVECDVAKCRNGRTGDVTLAFRKASMKFENAAEDVPQPPWQGASDSSIPD